MNQLLLTHEFCLLFRLQHNTIRTIVIILSPFPTTDTKTSHDLPPRPKYVTSSEDGHDNWHDDGHDHGHEDGHDNWHDDGHENDHE